MDEAEQFNNLDLLLIDDDKGNSQDEISSEEGFTMRTEEIFKISDPNMNFKNLSDHQKMIDRGFKTEYSDCSITVDDSYHSCSSAMDLVVLDETSDDESISQNCDEKNDLHEKIKSKIIAKLKEDSHSETSELRDENLENDQNIENDQQEIDPNLKEALLRIKHLDRVLARKIKKEKKVKADRIRLVKSLHAELSELQKTKSQTQSLEIASNTEKFLSLTLPTNHDKGVKVSYLDDENSSPITPVFQTQLDEDVPIRSQFSDKSTSSVSGNCERRRSDGAIPKAENCGGVGAPYGLSNDGSDIHLTAKPSKNYIKRNIKLASDAANTVAMTDEEKIRLEKLLENVDTLPEESPSEDVSQTDGSNPYQITLSCGEGFLPLATELKRLEYIDEKLRVLMSPADFEAISTVSSRSLEASQGTLFTRTAVEEESSTGTGLLGDEPGQATLKTQLKQRTVNNRLKEIERKLSHLSNGVNDEVNSQRLTESQLSNLLDECAKSISRTMSETASSRGSDYSFQDKGSCRSEILNNPPHLSKETLNQLLQEARSESSLSDRQSVASQRTHTSSSREKDLLNQETIRQLLNSSSLSNHSSSKMENLIGESSQQVVTDFNEMNNHFLPEITNSGILGQIQGHHPP